MFEDYCTKICRVNCRRMESIQRESNLFGLVRRVSFCVKQWHILSGASLIASRTRPIESVECTLDSFQYPIRQNGLSSHAVAMSSLRQFSNCSLQLLESKCNRICSNTNISEKMLSPKSVIFVFGRLIDATYSPGTYSLPVYTVLQHFSS